MKRTKTLCLNLMAMLYVATQSAQAQSVDYISSGEVFRIEAQTTQSERKAGWRIVDIQLKSTVVRYLWGRHSKQLVDNDRPQFVVDTDTLLLSDMVLIPLKTKREYRRETKPEIKDNECIYVDFSNFDIQPYGDDDFIIRPLRPLPAGEYIFTWTTLPSVGELQDWMVWPFSIE